MQIEKVTITGADDTTDIQWMREISEQYPFVEWGILVSKRSMGVNRFPSLEWIGRLVEHQSEMKTAIHVCGKWVRQILSGDWSEFITEIGTAASNAQRVQLNFHAGAYKLGDKFIQSAKRAARDGGWQLIFQVDGVNDDLLLNARNARLDAVPLYDLSGGTGVLPALWPQQVDGIYSGYAGGLGPDNVLAQIARISSVASGKIWIDMETNVRTEDDHELDCFAVESVLKQCSVNMEIVHVI